MAGTELLTRTGGPEEGPYTAVMVVTRLAGIIGNNAIAGIVKDEEGITWLAKTGRINGTQSEWDGTEVTVMRPGGEIETGDGDPRQFAGRLKIDRRSRDRNGREIIYPVKVFGYAVDGGYDLQDAKGLPIYREATERHHEVNCFVLDSVVQFAPGVADPERPQSVATVTLLRRQLPPNDIGSQAA